MKHVLVVLFFCLGTVWAGCTASGSASTPSDQEAPSGSQAPKGYPFRVVATTGMVADIVSNVVGSHGKVVPLIGDGIDPHLYKPTRADVAHLAEADLVFYSGHMLEGKMSDVLAKISAKRPVHAVTESLDPKFLLTPPEMEGHPDPHLWMDVRAWMAAVELVRDRLVEYDPDHRADYEANCTNYLSQLEKLDAYARQSLASIPAEKRVLVTAHDAFNYMGRAYDLQVRGIQGLSTESEAGLADLNALVGFLVERKIEAVFVETSVAEKNVMALIEGARARGSQVEVGGKLYSDAMGEAGSYEGTYIGMIDHNVTTITRALGGQAPAKGFQGRLR